MIQTRLRGLASRRFVRMMVCLTYQRSDVKSRGVANPFAIQTDCILWELCTSSLSFCSRAQIALPPTNDNLVFNTSQRYVLARFAQTRIYQAAVDLIY